MTETIKAFCEGLPRFAIVAPETMQPNSKYQVIVTMRDVQQPTLVDLKLYKGKPSETSEPLDSKSKLIKDEEPFVAEFEIGSWKQGKYTLVASGTKEDGCHECSSSKPKIEQLKESMEMELVASKHRGGLLFIQTDKAEYKAGEKVQMRESPVSMQGCNLTLLLTKSSISLSR